MHGPVAFIQDLAIVMIVAGVVTIVCHLLRQPVVLGYILAGVMCRGRSSGNYVRRAPCGLSGVPAQQETPPVSST